MQTPPPYAPPVRKNNTALIIVLVILGCSALCCIGVIALGWLGFAKAKDTIFPLAECAMSFEALREGATEYAKEHQGKLPATDKWEDALRPYYKAKIARFTKDMKDSPIKMEPMPVDGPWGCKLGPERFSGVAYNADVAGKQLDKLSSTTVLFFEVPERGENLAIPFKKQDKSKAPDMMGEKRPWIEATVEGDVNANLGSRRDVQL